MDEKKIYKFKTLDGKEVEKEFNLTVRGIFLFKKTYSDKITELFINNPELAGKSEEELSKIILNREQIKEFMSYQLEVTADFDNIKKFAEVSFKDGSSEIDFNNLDNLEEIERFASDFFSLVSQNLKKRKNII